MKIYEKNRSRMRKLVNGFGMENALSWEPKKSD